MAVGSEARGTAKRLQRSVRFHPCRCGAVCGKPLPAETDAQLETARKRPRSTSATTEPKGTHAELPKEREIRHGVKPHQTQPPKSRANPAPPCLRAAIIPNLLAVRLKTPRARRRAVYPHGQGALGPAVAPVLTFGARRDLPDAGDTPQRSDSRGGILCAPKPCPARTQRTCW